jgi:hypothetical protein
MALITRKSILSGIERTKDIEGVTEEKLEEWRGKDGNPGKPIQDVFPHMSPDDREFIMTGIVPEEWDQMFEDKPAPKPVDAVRPPSRRR